MDNHEAHKGHEEKHKELWLKDESVKLVEHVQSIGQQGQKGIHDSLWIILLVLGCLAVLIIVWQTNTRI